MQGSRGKKIHMVVMEIEVGALTRSSSREANSTSCGSGKVEKSAAAQRLKETV